MPKRTELENLHNGLNDVTETMLFELPVWGAWASEKFDKNSNSFWYFRFKGGMQGLIDLGRNIGSYARALAVRSVQK